MSNLTAPPPTEPVGLPAPTVDPVADRAPLPPPNLRVPAVPSPALPPLNGQPVVPVPHAAPAQPAASLAPPTLAPPTSAAPSAPEVPSSSDVLAEASLLEIPSLPSITPVKSTAPPVGGPGAHQPSQAGISVTARIEQLDPTKPTATAAAGATAKRSGRFAKTLALVVVAAGLGAGANIGYDYWQSTADVSTVAFDGTQLSTWPQVDPPAIRFVDSTTRLSTEAGTRSITSHTNLVDGARIVEVTDTDTSGLVTTYTGDEALALAGDPVIAGVFTVSDVFPAEGIPYITVLEGVERQLPLGPIQEARQPQAAPSSAVSTEPAMGMWHYRAIVDVESFRAAEPAAYEAWERRLGAIAVPRLEAWIDGTGVVRQIAADLDGTSVVHTLDGGAARSTKFEAPVAPANPDAAPTAPAELPAEAPVTE